MNITYFSPYLKSLAKYKPIWQQIEHHLRTEHELYDFVPNAKDIWVRDFMPVQNHEGEFLIYNYYPDYLQEKNEKYITNCRNAFIAIGGSNILSSNICNHTNLILDGGNIVKCVDQRSFNCVILTTKVLYENPDRPYREVLFWLEDFFRADIILIPWDTEDVFGHADGMVRSLDDGKLLLNCYSDFDPNLDKVIKKALGERFEIHELNYGEKFRDQSWCHLNYLELDNTILVPTANIASDKIALEQIEKYTAKKCFPIPMSPIITDEGALHCISWTMDTQIIKENNLFFPLS